ncbi:phage tail tape measure protein [Bacillus cereus]|uniref:phage tail tape measure protein n=2 Tax=Bacillus cereus group TaxID=86661 RepID=UPI0024BE5BD1|nr:phage tail tape measure protein [Bacillus cereus]
MAGFVSELRAKFSATMSGFRETIGGVRDSLRDMTRESAQQVQNNSQQLRQLQNDWGKVKLAAVASAGALGVAIGGAVTITDQYQSSLNGLQGATGATDKEMAGLGQSMKNIYAQNLGQDFNDIGQAMAFTKQTTGLAGKELEGMTKNGLMLRDTFQYEVNESVKVTDTMMKQFGISGDQAMTLIAQGAQSGLDKSGDMLDSFNEYSVYFKQLGFDAEGMWDVFKAGADGGAFNMDKVGDAVKEFGIRAKDGSKTTADGFKALGLDADEMAKKIAAGGPSAQEAMQQTFEALGKIEDPIERNAAGVALFGTQFEDLEHKTIIALGNVQKQANMSGDTLKKLDEVRYNSVGAALQGLGRMIIVEMLDPMQKKVMPALNGMINGLKQNMPAIKEAFATVFGAIGDAFAALEPTFNNVMKIIMPIGEVVGILLVGAFKALEVVIAPILNGFTSILATITQWEGFVPIMTGLVAGFLAYKAAILATNAPMLLMIARTNLLALASGALNAVMALNPIALIIGALVALGVALYVAYQKSETFRNVVNGLWQGLTTIVGGVIDWFATNIPIWIENIKAAWQGFKDWFSELWNGTIEGAKALWQGLCDWFNNLFTTTVEGAKFIWQGLSDFFSNLWNMIVLFAQMAWNGFIAFLTGLFTGAIAMITGIWNGISSFFVMLWTNIVAFVSPIVQGFISGILAFMSSLYTGIMTLLQPIFDFFVSTWENIKLAVLSIVALFLNLLTGNMEGAKVGLLGIWTAFKDQCIAVFTLFKDLAMTVWNAFTTGVKTIVEAVKNAVIAAFNFLKDGSLAIFNALKDAAVSSWNFLKSSVIAIVTGIRDGAINGWNALKSGVINLVNATKDGAINAWNALKSGVINLVNSIKDGAINSWNALKSGVINTVNALKDGAMNAWNALKSGISSAISGIVNFVTSGFNNAKSTAISMMEGLKNGVSNAINNVINFFRDMGSNIKSTISSINLYDIGKNIIQGLINGIKGMAKNVVGAITDVTSSITGKVKGLLGIHSPSRVFLQFGKFIGQGLTIGINKTEDMVAQASEGLANAAMVSTPAGEISGIADGAINADVKVRGEEDPDGGATQTNYNAPLMQIENYYQNSDADQRELSNGLYRMQVDHDRAKGFPVVSPA